MSSCKEKLFQSGEICRVLELPKQRFEYICNKLPLVPTIQAEGTGTANKYDFSTVYSCLVGDILSRWGYSFRFISNELESLKKSESALFNYCKEVQIHDRNSHVVWQNSLTFYQLNSEFAKGDVVNVNSPLKMDKYPMVAKWLKLMPYNFNVPTTFSEVFSQKKISFLEDSSKTKSENSMPKKKEIAKDVLSKPEEHEIAELIQNEDDLKYLKYLDFTLNLSLLKYWLVSQL